MKHHLLADTALAAIIPLGLWLIALAFNGWSLS